MFASGKDKGLDGGSRNILTPHIKFPYYYYMKRKDLMIVDIKSKTSLSKFKIRENHTLINIDKLNEIEEHKLIISLW